MGGSQRQVGTICYNAKVCIRSSLKAVQLLSVFFLWKNFLALPDLRESFLVLLHFFSLIFSHYGNYLLNQWQYEPLLSKNNRTLMLYLDFQLPFLIQTCRFPGTAANYLLPWSFHGLLPFLSFSLFSFVDNTSSTSECSVLSKKRFTLQGFTNLKSQKGNLKKRLDCFLWKAVIEASPCMCV